MVLWIVLGILVLLLVVALVRAMLLKPTSAKTATVTLDTSERAKRYGERLAKMIRKETVSSRFEEDRSKFYEFHQLLEELFPNLHSHCEKKDFDGSLLFKWRGKSEKEPILLMWLV